MESAWKVLGKSFLWQALAVACIIYMIFTIHVQYIGKDCRCRGVWCASIDSRFLGVLGYSLYLYGFAVCIRVCGFNCRHVALSSFIPGGFLSLDFLAFTCQTWSKEIDTADEMPKVW